MLHAPCSMLHESSIPFQLPTLISPCAFQHCHTGETIHCYAKMKVCLIVFAIEISIFMSHHSVDAFGVQLPSRGFHSKSSLHSAPSSMPKAKPRTGIAQNLLNFALTSPLWKLVLVPQARSNIVKTAEANGIQWERALSWIKSQDGPWRTKSSASAEELISANTDASGVKVVVPKYYRQEFHAYDNGNLEWNAALEQEIASRAVGARNFPAYGADGEDAFRGAFDNAIRNLGGKTRLPQGVIVDMGCGTGTSTRRLAAAFPDAKEIVGMDLSPYMIEVGRKLLEFAPTGQSDGGDWVTTITPDERIELLVRDIANTNMDDESVDIVNLGLVIHELPIEATNEICREALRILKPGGQLWISEMDYDSPAFAEQRSNALLFSLIRSTEPYLDVYADGVEEVRDNLVKLYDSVKITAATGRHYALIATKGDGDKTSATNSLEDSRFDAKGNYVVDDTHLKTWESKSE